MSTATERRGKYREWFPELARWMARYGLTAVEIAQELGVSRPLLYQWRKRYPDFAAAMDEGRDLADARVEDSLYQRAVGIHASIRKTNRQGQVVEVDVFEPGDVTACIFWLKNRRPAQWRDVQRTEHTGRDGGPIEHITSDQIDREIARLEAELAKNDSRH